MADALTTITHLINSPPGQLAAGGVLAGIVWKFFERVEAVLTDQTKLEIAVWLLGVKVGQKVEPWPDTFAKMFDRVFGEKHWSLKCFWRSCIASYCAIAICFAVWAIRLGPHTVRFVGSWKNFVLLTVICGGIGNLIPDYISLLETRWMLRRMSKANGRLRLLLVDASITTGIGVIGGLIADMSYMVVLAWRRPEMYCFEDRYNCLVRNVTHYLLELRVVLETHVSLLQDLSLLFLPYLCAAFFTSIWLWLYAGSGFILKAALRFDSAVGWMNSHMKIEENPLQSIGLVAGALVAVMYWAAVIVARTVG
jgi:hypothetical protein